MKALKTLNSAKALLLTVLISLNTQAELKKLEGIAVIVDEDVILMTEYNQRLKLIKQQIKEQNKTVPEEVIRQQLLDRLILESLQLQMAQRAGATIPDDQLNYTLNNIAQNNGMDLPAFVKMLTEQGQDYTQFRDQVKRDMLIQRVQQGNLAKKVKVSDDEIEAYLETEEGKDLKDGSFKIDHLLLPVSSSASDQEKIDAEKMIEAIRKKAINNKLKLFSPDIKKSFNKSNYSDLGWRKASDLPSLFTDIAPQLKLNEISKPINSSSGWHLISVVDKKGGSGQLEKQTKVRHILITPNEVVTEEKAKEKIDDIYKKLKNGEDFEKLAKEFSDDHGSALAGGDIGWQTPEKLVPAFAQIMQHSKIGELSEPFKSRFGWHILEVTERREYDVSIDQAKDMAYRKLFQQKFDEELEAWLLKIRDEAYIDIKI